MSRLEDRLHLSKWWTYGQDFEGNSRRSLRTNSSKLDACILNNGIYTGDASTIVYHIFLSSGEKSRNSNLLAALLEAGRSAIRALVQVLESLRCGVERRYKGTHCCQALRAFFALARRGAADE